MHVATSLPYPSSAFAVKKPEGRALAQCDQNWRIFINLWQTDEGFLVLDKILNLLWHTLCFWAAF